LRRIQQNYLPELGNTLTQDGLKTIVPRLAKMTRAQRAELPGVSSSRSIQIVAGVLVAECAMNIFGIEKITQCPWALREGIVLQRLDWLQS
jgi:exopolyphosphatase/guanosine-5'-triphosphate,3'-diphosphate pyrophosphatase